ncbi:MAG TPA: DUF1028 domain-containing protein [candidate division Zixibacteria bacterium]|nr:DUF1028 domain-containing protein [candidate division Zixibacteria bacterium]
MTFSIVAIDKNEKEVGFAIASCAWNAGIVCRAETEKGTIASQAQGNLLFHSVFFKQINENKSLEQIMTHFREIDERIESRQIGMITFKGESFAFTGENCTFWAGHKIGKDYACQGNILVGPEVIEEMTSAFEKTNGSLKEKLFAALQAGDNTGGDARGKQSARLLVKKKGGGARGASDIVIDIIIEDHEEPVQEIGRILGVHKNLDTLYGYYAQLQKAEGEEEKLLILEKAGKFLQGKEKARHHDFWLGIGYAYLEIGKNKEAIYYFKKALEISPKTIAIYEKSAQEGKLPEEIVKALLEK